MTLTLNPKPWNKYHQDFTWENRHENLKITPERYYEAWNRLEDGSDPSSDRWRCGLNALRRIAYDAGRAGKRVRAVGGAWSLSHAAMSEDYMIDTQPLNVRDIGLNSSSVVPRLDIDPDHLVFAQCGNQVLELNQRLESRNLSLPTSGASNGQTFCGAFSTGTHGSAVNVGSMQDFVHGLHIVSGEGKHFWLERATKPVISESFRQKLGAELKRDDRLFNAALVSFGSFGLIHAVLFEAEPIYLLETHSIKYDWEQLEPVAGTLDISSLGLPDGNTMPFHFEIIVNPYARGTGDKGAVVRALYKRPYEPHKITPPADPDNLIEKEPGADMLGFIGSVTDAVPQAIPPAVGQFFNSMFEDGPPRIRTHGNTFGGTNIKGKGTSTEIGVPLSHSSAAVNAILAVADDYPFAGVVVLRYVAQSSALLAFTRFAPTCTIELPGVGSDRSVEFFKRVWDRLDGESIPYTLHWGQLNNFTPDRVRRMWGDAAVDDWLSARRSFLSPAERKLFSNDLTDKAGLSE